MSFSCLGQYGVAWAHILLMIAYTFQFEEKVVFYIETKIKYKSTDYFLIKTYKCYLYRIWKCMQGNIIKSDCIILKYDIFFFFLRVINLLVTKHWSTFIAPTQSR